MFSEEPRRESKEQRAAADGTWTIKYVKNDQSQPVVSVMCSTAQTVLLDIEVWPQTGGTKPLSQRCYSPVDLDAEKAQPFNGSTCQPGTYTLKACVFQPTDCNSAWGSLIYCMPEVQFSI